MANYDNYIKPVHYSQLIIDGQRIDPLFIGDRLNWSFTVANAVKYLWRAGKKENEEDIKDITKAIECLERRLGYLNNSDNHLQVATYAEEYPDIYIGNTAITPRFLADKLQWNVNIETAIIHLWDSSYICTLQAMLNINTAITHIKYYKEKLSNG